MRGMQATVTRATTLLYQYSCLLIVGGALVNYQLPRAKGRPVRPVQSPPQRATMTPPRESPSARHAGSLRHPAAAAGKAGGSAGTGGAYEGGTGRPTPISVDTRGVKRNRAGASGDRRDPG